VCFDLSSLTHIAGEMIAFEERRRMVAPFILDKRGVSGGGGSGGGDGGSDYNDTIVCTLSLALSSRRADL